MGEVLRPLQVVEKLRGVHDDRDRKVERVVLAVYATAFWWL